MNSLETEAEGPIRKDMGGASKWSLEWGGAAQAREWQDSSNWYFSRDQNLGQQKVCSWDCEAPLSSGQVPFPAADEGVEIEKLRDDEGHRLGVNQT